MSEEGSLPIEKSSKSKTPFIVIPLLLVLLLVGGTVAAFVVNKNAKSLAKTTALAVKKKQEADEKAYTKRRAEAIAALEERVSSENTTTSQANAAAATALSGEWKDTEGRFTFVISGTEYKIPSGLTPPSENLERRFWVDAGRGEFYYDLQESDKGKAGMLDYYVFKYSLSEDGSELTVRNVSSEEGDGEAITYKRLSSDPNSKPNTL